MISQIGLKSAYSQFLSSVPPRPGAQWFEPCHNYYFFHFFFVLYIYFNLSDDVFEEKKIFFP
jgi:hypothetical protein